MSKLGTIVTVTDPYTDTKCAALVIGEREDGTLDLRVFRADRNDIELFSVALAVNEPATQGQAPEPPTDVEPSSPAPVESYPTPSTDGTSHSDQGGPAPVVATPVQQ